MARKPINVQSTSENTDVYHNIFNPGDIPETITRDATPEEAKYFEGLLIPRQSDSFKIQIVLGDLND